MNKTYQFIILCIIFLASCDTRMQPVDDLKDFAEELKENSNKYTDEDWKEALNNYEKIQSEISANKYSDNELKEIGSLKVQCASYFTKSMIKNIKSMLHDAFFEVKGAAESIQSSIDSTDGF